MYHIKHIAAVILAVFFVTAPAAQALEILVQQSPPVVASPVVAASDESFGIFAFDDFVFAKKAKILQVIWFGNQLDALEDGTSPDDFTIEFYSDDNGFPGATLASYSGISPVEPVDKFVTNIPDEDGVLLFAYSADIDGPILDAGELYYISIFNNTDGADVDGDNQWIWAFSDLANGVNFFADDFGLGLDIGDLAFELIGVPEPSAMALFLVGLAGLSGGYRQRRKSLI